MSSDGQEEIIDQVSAIMSMKANRVVIAANEKHFNNILSHYLFAILAYHTMTRQIPWGEIISSTSSWMIWTPMGCAVSWIFVDVLTYFVHMFLDSPSYMKWIAEPMQRTNKGRFALVDDHHRLTLNYSYMNNVELVSIIYPVSLPVLGCMFAYHTWINQHIIVTSPFYVGFYVSTTFLSLIVGYAHKWAHERNHGLIDARSLVGRLQDMGVLLDAEAHRRHHVNATAVQQSNAQQPGHYSLLNGIAQRILDPLFQCLRCFRCFQ